MFLNIVSSWLSGIAPSRRKSYITMLIATQIMIKQPRYYLEISRAKLGPDSRMMVELVRLFADLPR
jgi:hypothetical protein